MGEGVDDENAQALLELMEEKYPDAEFVCQSGGQPLYYYYIAVE